MELSDYPIRLAWPRSRYRSRLIATGYRQAFAAERANVRIAALPVAARLTEKLDKGNLQVG